MAGRNIYQQIEQTADFYGPDTYRQALEVDPNHLDLAMDPLSADFIPITSVRRFASDEYLPFIIGILPPSANVTGRLLAREDAKIGGAVGDEADDIAQPGEPYSGGPIKKLGVSKSGYCVVDPTTGPSRENLSDDFWVKFVQMCQRLGVNPFDLAAVIDSESSWRPGSQYLTGGTLKEARKDPTKVGVVAQGLNQIHESNIGKNKLLDMPPEVWKCFGELPAEQQLPWVEKFFRGRSSGKSTIAGQNAHQIYAKNAGGYPNPDGSIYASYAAQDAWNSANPSKPFNPKIRDSNNSNFNGNKGVSSDGLRVTRADLVKRVQGKPSEQIKSKIQQAIDRIGGDAPPPYDDPTKKKMGTEQDPSQEKNANNQWQAGGKNDSQQAQKDATKNDKKAPEERILASKYLPAQRATILYLQTKLQEMANTPPLKLLVNPMTFSVSHSKLINDGGWARTGGSTHIIEHWGDNQDKISMSGKVGAFMALDRKNGNGPGLTRTARNLTESYANLMALFVLYKNNGAIYMPETADGALSNQKNLAMLGSIYIYFDGMLYIGSFDSFSIKEEDSSPFSLEYDFEFTIRASFLLDKNPQAVKTTTAKKPDPLLTGLRITRDIQVTDIPADEIPLPKRTAELIRSEARKPRQETTITPSVIRSGTRLKIVD